MKQLKNLPKEGQFGIKVEDIGHSYRLFNIKTHAIMCNISKDNILKELSHVILEARDLGYKQALKDIRTLLGVEGK